jgi:S1-C subfamily serine protease
MDTISTIIIDAVGKVKNSMVKIVKYGKDDKPSGTGSGFIFSTDGYIFSNHHVITNSCKLTVTLLNGEEFEPGIVGSDADTDVGILKLYGSGPEKISKPVSLKILRQTQVKELDVFPIERPAA